MKYEIVEAPRLSRAYKYGQIPDLGVGQGFHVPWADLSANTVTPAKGAQNTAYYYGKKLGRRYITRQDRAGVWIVRAE